jgi:hypothetical protein
MAQTNSVPSQAVAAYYVDAKGDLLIREEITPQIRQSRELGETSECFPLTCPPGQKLCGPVNGRYYCCQA